VADCGEEVLLTGRIKGRVKLECSRCLEDTWQQLDVEDLPQLSSVAGIIDIEDELRQLLVLNIPTVVLCKDECKGLCAVCGKNRNITPCECSLETYDPRWKKLRQITKKAIK